MTPQLKVLKERNCQLGILYPVNSHFRDKGEIQPLSKEGKLREFIVCRPAIKKLPKEAF